MEEHFQIISVGNTEEKKVTESSGLTKKEPGKIDERKAKLATLRINNEKKNIQNAYEIGIFDKNEEQIEFTAPNQWRLGIRGKPGTIWEGGLYCATITFPDDYPESPPHFEFDKDFEHVHIYSSGDVCLDLVNRELTYKPTTTMRIMIAEIIRLIHDKPNPKSPANTELNKLYLENVEQYEKKIRENAKKLADKKLI